MPLVCRQKVGSAGPSRTREWSWTGCCRPSRSTISNTGAHFFSWVWRPFRIGQEIELVQRDVRGQVVSSNLMFTEPREEGGDGLHVPNNFFFQNIIRLASLREPDAEERRLKHDR